MKRLLFIIVFGCLFLDNNISANSMYGPSYVAQEDNFVELDSLVLKMKIDIVLDTFICLIQEKYRSSPNEDYITLSFNNTDSLNNQKIIRVIQYPKESIHQHKNEHTLGYVNYKGYIVLIYGDWAEEQLIIGHGFPTYKLKRDPLFEYPKDGALCDMKMWWEIPVTIEMATKSFHGNKRRTRKKR